MRLQFKHQAFQAEAAKAVVDVFAGQPYMNSSYLMDKGDGLYQQTLLGDDFTGWGNFPIVPALSDDRILKNLRKVQYDNHLKLSEALEGRFNLTIEMETGVGKTYTYIKTMYELNQHYGWRKFIVVVPSIAIREGVYKSFQVTCDHFAEEYGKKVRFFIYNSKQLTEIDRFASDDSICVMIINSQAFNAKGKDARRISMKLDEFRSRRPIDIIAKTNPIVIIDEPQSVEGKQTKENLKKFHPLMTLRYSATHKKDSLYNMVYRLDAVDAYNKHLVKKIRVIGISESGTTATESYVYLERVNLSQAVPTATIQFDCKGKSGVRKVTRTVSEKANLYDLSNGLDEYKEGFVVSHIDGRDDSVEFVNGIKICAGDVIGQVNEDDLRRLQIRETILAHLEKERALFGQGIKVLSLFFIDEVAKYRVYDAAGEPQNGVYAKMFEEEYADILSQQKFGIGDDTYLAYLRAIPVEKTHAGYFSIDKKGKMVDSKLTRKETTTDDVDAYDLIMKNKELLLDRDPKRSPVRFIFSHSALREGWDNPNVFQICTLKQSASDVRKRQEVGRGLRLCVNQAGERMDAEKLGKEVQEVNLLTVIASESYESFADGLQKEIAEAVADRPQKMTQDFLENKALKDKNGNQVMIDKSLATVIYNGLVRKDYIDDDGHFTETYYEDKKREKIRLPEKVEAYRESLLTLFGMVSDGKTVMVENGRSNNVELKVDDKKLAMPEFQALWKRINGKTSYVVDFDTEELIQKAISSLDSHLQVSKIYFKVESGTMDRIDSKDALMSGTAFEQEKNSSYGRKVAAGSRVKYDLIGKLVEETKLTRKAAVRILKGIRPDVFRQFQDNPEEFILKAAALINDEKATVIVNHITYNVLDDHYDNRIFTEPTMKGRLGANAMKTKKHIYDHLLYDSDKEKEFADELDTSSQVAVYVKLPSGFYISTPVGHYNPDWAIAFYEGNVKHIYFVAETKGSMRSMDLRPIEQAKIKCAKEHFRALSRDDVRYDVVDSYEALLNKVMK